LIHQFALPNGLDNSNVKRLHKRAKECGIYTSVLRRDWAKRNVERDLAYATVNHKEFFAEMSVSYLADFYHHLNSATIGDGMDACCPPLYDSQWLGQDNHTDPNFSTLPHCNKFFPFTRGQFLNFDKVSYSGVSALWDVIGAWIDDETDAYDADSGLCYQNPTVKSHADVKPKLIEFDNYMDETVSL